MGEVGGFLWKEGGRERKVPRIGPLFHSLKPQTDPDPARTEKVVAALKALARGREGDRRFALAHARSARGFRRRPRAGPWPVCNPSSSSRSRTSSARGIERHKGRVSRILHYRLVTDKADRGLLIHMTADGLITDFDIVED